MSKYLSITELKSFLNISTTDQDSYLQSVLDTSEGVFESLINTNLIFDEASQNTEQIFNGGWEFWVKKFPLRSIVEFRSDLQNDFVDVDVVKNTFDDRKIYLSEGLRVSWRNYKVIFKAGYDKWDSGNQTKSVPKDIKSFLCELVRNSLSPKNYFPTDKKSETFDDYSYTNKGVSEIGLTSFAMNSPVLSKIVSKYSYIDF